MTAVALKLFDRDPRTTSLRDRRPANDREFADIVERTRQPSPKATTRKLLEDNGPAERAGLQELLSRIPPREMPHGGIPEAIATEVSVVIDLPDETLVATAEPTTVIEDEISDGIPIAIEARPRQMFDEEEAQTTAYSLLAATMGELGRANTELALPIVTVSKSQTVIIPDAVPVLPDLAAKLAANLPAPASSALTPLEQAVQELIAGLDREDTDEPLPAMSPLLPEVRLLAVEHADPVTPVAPLRDPQLLPENTNPSHVHLVIDDGAERVVVTVAVRGSEVNVALRGQDDATNAALARNAGSLDHAMRARGLDLASLMTGRDPDSKHRPDRDQRDRDRRKDTFSLEELA